MATLIICPACGTRYETKAAFPPEGRKVRCSKCGNVWQALPVTAPLAQPAPMAPPPQPRPQPAPVAAPPPLPRPAAAVNAAVSRAKAEAELLAGDLDDEDLAAIEEGLAELRRGEGRPWEEVRAELRAKYPPL